MENLVGPVLTKAKLAKPFLKWAGGKTQLLDKFEHFYPKDLKEGKIKKYFEPFVGSGAVFFYIMNNYRVEKAYLGDNNSELILAYGVIKGHVELLIDELEAISSEYFKLSDNKRATYYYDMRQEFNSTRVQILLDRYSEAWVRRAAQLIFLNRTCFNGLYRVNRDGEFNVPFGRYKQPRILDAENLKRVSAILQGVTIRRGDFECFTNDIDSNSFVYFDPPYRPLSKSANFTSYTSNSFGEEDQIRLARYFRQLNMSGARVMLSNSDPQNGDSCDRFFEDHYQGFRMSRVEANRMINCDASKRGRIKEIVIVNY